MLNFSVDQSLRCIPKNKWDILETYILIFPWFRSYQLFLLLFLDDISCQLCCWLPHQQWALQENQCQETFCHLGCDLSWIVFCLVGLHGMQQHPCNCGSLRHGSTKCRKISTVFHWIMGWRTHGKQHLREHLSI